MSADISDGDDHRIFPPEHDRGTLVCDVLGVGFGDIEVYRLEHCPACGRPLSTREGS